MRSTMHAWYEAVRRIRWLLDAEYDQSYPVTMKTIAAAKFKEQCLALLDSVTAAPHPIR